MVLALALWGGKLTSVKESSTGFLLDRVGALEYFELSSSERKSCSLFLAVDRATVRMFDPVSGLFVLLGQWKSGRRHSSGRCDVICGRTVSIHSIASSQFSSFVSR